MEIFIPKSEKFQTGTFPFEISKKKKKKVKKKKKKKRKKNYFEIFIIFQEMELSSQKSRNFREEICKVRKTNKETNKQKIFPHIS